MSLLLEVRNSTDARELFGWLPKGSDLLPTAIVSDEVGGGQHVGKWEVFSSHGKTLEELKALPGFISAEE